MSNDEYGFGNSGYSTGGQSANISFGTQNRNVQAASRPVEPETAVASRDISTAEFGQEVIQASMQTPVLVDFWAPWCGPCKQLAPNLERAVAATRGKVRLVKMDIDKHPEVAGQMGIQSIPAVVAFVGGKPADAFMGAKSEAEIREFIGRIAGGNDASAQIDQLIEQAENLSNEGDDTAAGQIYAHILSAEPDNIKAISGLGHLYIRAGELENARNFIAQLTDEQLKEAEIVSLISAIELAEQAQALGGTLGELEEKLAANPEDLQAQMDLAIALNGLNRREEAADQLLDIMKKKPGWNDDAARAQLLQFFEAWGMTDENTVAARRKLSSLLFS